MEKKAKIAALTVFLIALGASASQALVIFTDTGQRNTRGAVLVPPKNIMGQTLSTWEDDFLDESKIDVTKSYNYLVDKNTGYALMKDTYEAWYNPNWARMKTIDITNPTSVTFEGYVLDITVHYDTDMRSDFKDLRFVDMQGNNLYYWIGEHIDGESATVLVRIPELPSTTVTTIHMFYGDPTATDGSTFDEVFTWEDRTSPDILISYKSYSEGAWDPDVAFGNNRYLVAWEEGLGPEDIIYDGDRLFYRQIHGRTYDDDGNNPYPPPQQDLDLYISSSSPTDFSYHAENPSIAYGNGYFFIAWEENPATPNHPQNRYEVDIKGALMQTDGTITSRFTICEEQNSQYDPVVAYGNGRYFIVWEDARDGTTNYDVYGRLYDNQGVPLGADFQVAGGANCQCEPWICPGDDGYFMVVYEEGNDPETGPFSLSAQRFDSMGNKVGSAIPIASGSSTLDNIFPAVAYCPQTERYFFTWNDGDVSIDPSSRSSYDGNIWGKIVDKYGNTISNNFIIQQGNQYIRTDVVPYLDTLFFVSYDGISDLWGRLVSSDGKVQTEEHMLSDGSSQSVDWNNLAVGNGKLFAVWEDERDVASNYADAFGSVWHIYRSTGSPQVTYTFSDEKEIVTETVVVSIPIQPGEGFLEWGTFDAAYSLPVGHLEFDILNSQGTQVLMKSINPGKDISSLSAQEIRLKATLTRTLPNATPRLDKWNVSWMGEDYDPPWTEYETVPAFPNGEQGWYTTPVEFIFYPHDDVTPLEHLVTYYIINDGETQRYTPASTPKITSEYSDNTMEFWSVDLAGNEETPHNRVEGIAIDMIEPQVVIETPDWGKVPQGDVKVSGTVHETVSGVEDVQIWFNGGRINENQIVLTPSKDSFEWHFTADTWQQYDIEVWVYDTAGNVGKASVSVKCTRKTQSVESKISSIQDIIEAGCIQVHDCKNMYHPWDQDHYTFSSHPWG